MKYLLSEGEEFVINVGRNFGFLRGYFYFGSQLWHYGRDYRVAYSNLKIGTEVLIEYDGLVKIYFRRSPNGTEQSERDIFFEVLEIYSEFEIEKSPENLTINEALALYAKFFKKHLIPVVKGEMWIDELLRARA